MKTYTNNNEQTTILNAVEAAAWINHAWRNPVRDVIKMVEKDAAEEAVCFEVKITASQSVVELTAEGGKFLATLTFRNWMDTYAGVSIDSIYGKAAFALRDNSIINL